MMDHGKSQDLPPEESKHNLLTKQKTPTAPITSSMRGKEMDKTAAKRKHTVTAQAMPTSR